MVSVLRSKVQGAQDGHVLQAAQHSVRILASQHCAAVVSSLLGGPLPFDRYWAPAGLRGRTPGLGNPFCPSVVPCTPSPHLPLLCSSR